MGIKIEETFQVSAPVARVWDFLVDPLQVVQCLPGAELLEARDEDTFAGRVRVKVGPVTASYTGTATFVERDDSKRLVRLAGEGRESSGSGSAKMTMASQLVELADGRTEVRVVAELELAGRIVQFGRGMLEEVNRQLFRQFTECTRTRLERAGGPESPSTDPITAAPAAVPDREPTTPPQPQTERATAPHPDAGAGEPVRALPLLWRAVSAIVKRLLGRWSGRT